MTQIIEPDTEVGDIAAAAGEVPTDASLYERLGGAYAIAGAVDVLFDRLFVNAAVNANDGVHAHHGDASNGPGYKFLVTSWSIEAAGGPPCYLGRDMVAAHDGLFIDEAGFDAVALEIASTLSFLGVPARERDELNAIIEGYRSQVVQAPAFRSAQQGELVAPRVHQVTEIGAAVRRVPPSDGGVHRRERLPARVGVTVEEPLDQPQQVGLRPVLERVLTQLPRQVLVCRAARVRRG